MERVILGGYCLTRFTLNNFNCIMNNIISQHIESMLQWLKVAENSTHSGMKIIYTYFILNKPFLW